MSLKYGVQAASFSEAIHVGTLNPSRQSFRNKEDATDMVLFAVAQYVSRNFEGGMTVTFPKTGEHGIQMTVTVEPMEGEARCLN